MISSCIWTDDIEYWWWIQVTSYEGCKDSPEEKSGLQRDSNPWPPRYRCHALPTELWSLMGTGQVWVQFHDEDEILYTWWAHVYEPRMLNTGEICPKPCEIYLKPYGSSFVTAKVNSSPIYMYSSWFFFFLLLYILALNIRPWPSVAVQMDWLAEWRKKLQSWGRRFRLGSAWSLVGRSPLSVRRTRKWLHQIGKSVSSLT